MGKHKGWMRGHVGSMRRTWRGMEGAWAGIERFSTKCFDLLLKHVFEFS